MNRGPELEGGYYLAITTDIIKSLKAWSELLGCIGSTAHQGPLSSYCCKIAIAGTCGKNLNGKDIYVNQQYPSEVAKHGQFCRTPFKTAHGQERVMEKIDSDWFYINNKLQHHFLPPVLPDTQPEDDTEPPTLYSSMALKSPNMVDPQVEYIVLRAKWIFQAVCWGVAGFEWGRTSVYFRITYVCFIPGRLPVFAVSSQYQHRHFFFKFC